MSRRRRRSPTLIDVHQPFHGAPVRTAWKRCSAFIADSAHQIRTPLTALVAPGGTARQSRNRRRRTRASYRAGARRAPRELARLTNQLLSDAMVSHRAQQSSGDQVDLGATRAPGGGRRRSGRRSTATSRCAHAIAGRAGDDPRRCGQPARGVPQCHGECHPSRRRRTLVGAAWRATATALGPRSTMTGRAFRRSEWPQATERFFRGRTERDGLRPRPRHRRRGRRATMRR